jgi:signal transduction histidine kinase
MPRLSIRRKLAVALAVPLTALVVLTVLEVVKTAREADKVGEQTELAKSAIGPSGIITALQNERTWLSVELIGQVEQVNVPVRGYDETRAQTDAAIDSFRDEIANRNQVVAEAFQPALDGLDDLDDVRADIDADPGAHDLTNLDFVDGIFDRYTALIEPFFEGTTRVAVVIDDPDLRQGAELADAVARQVETLSLLLNTTITDATTSEGGIDQPQEITTISMLQSEFQHQAAILREPTGPYARLAQELYPAPLTERVNQNVDAAISTGRVDLESLLADVDVPDEEGYTGYMRALHARINDRADDVRSTADARQIWFGALAGLALFGAIALTLQVSRSITQPLRSLTSQAKDMAGHRLPNAVLDILETPLGNDVHVPHIEPVGVRTRDEVADVAAALNTVQESALKLAVEQAVLRRNIADSFVNLGRRNQNLLGRQLDFITELESNETDAETLASLFRLDHLATRMRRNAESLLVLAGIEPPRKWAAPVRLNDVVRAALGEVEDYHRVTVRGVEPATVVGALAADLAHLIAELLENALTFSPPDHHVDVRGRLARESGGYELAIVDAGLGMTPADLDQANRRLAGTESFTVAPSKYLGHYVAGNLAARHGITIRLDPTPGHGITASIVLPPSLLAIEHPTGDAVAAPPTPAPRPYSEPGHDPAPPAPPTDRPAAEPWAPRPVPGLPTGGHPPSAPLPAPPQRTLNGLAKRPPTYRQPGGAAANVPGDDLLAALNHHTGRLKDQRITSRPSSPSGPRPAEPPTPPPGPQPDDADRAILDTVTPDTRDTRGGRRPSSRSHPPSRGTTAAGLTRRVRGAQLPPTEPVPLRRGNEAPANIHDPRGRMDDAAARDVYGFLANFTAGIQRGLDETRQSDRRREGA